MAGITLAQAEAQLATWVAADTKLAQAQSYRMPDGRMLTRADAGFVLERIKFWDAQVKALSGAGLRIGYGVNP
jgi:hypothetical protein